MKMASINLTCNWNLQGFWHTFVQFVKIEQPILDPAQSVVAIQPLSSPPPSTFSQFFLQLRFHLLPPTQA